MKLLQLRLVLMSKKLMPLYKNQGQVIWLLQLHFSRQSKCLDEYGAPAQIGTEFMKSSSNTRVGRMKSLAGLNSEVT